MELLSFQIILNYLLYVKKKRRIVNHADYNRFAEDNHHCYAHICAIILKDIMELNTNSSVVWLL